MEIGQIVTVFYPWDASWYRTRGVVIDKYEDDMYMVQDEYNNKIMIQSGFIKSE